MITTFEGKEVTEFNKYLMSIWYVVDTVPGTWDMSEHKTRSPVLMELAVPFTSILPVILGKSPPFSVSVLSCLVVGTSFDMDTLPGVLQMSNSTLALTHHPLSRKSWELVLNNTG
jgi:hypothetical protein